MARTYGAGVMSSPDLLVVGAGLTGATIARLAIDAGYNVTVIERRSVVGGNVADTVHPSGIRYGLYGPHYFRTDSQKIWDFVCRFSKFRPFAAEVRTLIDGKLEAWPITREYLDRNDLRMPESREQGSPATFEDACLAKMPSIVYERFVRGYTEKQWGVTCTQLDASLAGRFDVREDGDRRLKTSEWQGVPEQGYSALVATMLKNIEVWCSADYKIIGEIAPLTVFTGPIDEFFNFDIGHLRYRAQHRVVDWYRDEGFVYPTVSTNLPQHLSAIRVIEWRHIMPEVGLGCLLTWEHPYNPIDSDAYEYPFPSAIDRTLYSRYAKRAMLTPEIIFAGRLGEYRYLDMDQAIGRAMMRFERDIAPRLSKA